jgi:tricorn protease
MANLDSTDRFMRFPQLSPDGLHIAFGVSSQNSAAPKYLYVSNADGTGSRMVTDKFCINTVPAFSPDGNRIAFFTEDNYVYSVTVANTDGTAPHAICSIDFPNKTIFGRLAWGKQDYIAFVDDTTLYVIRSDGSDKRIVQQGAHSPSWSPNGSTLAFTFGIGHPPAVSAKVGLYDVAKNQSSTLVNQPSSAWVLPSWSADGTKIIGSVTSDPNLATGTIMSVDVQSGAESTLVHDGMLGYYAR